MIWYLFLEEAFVLSPITHASAMGQITVQIGLDLEAALEQALTVHGLPQFLVWVKELHVDRFSFLYLATAMRSGIFGVAQMNTRQCAPENIRHVSVVERRR